MAKASKARASKPDSKGTDKGTKRKSVPAATEAKPAAKAKAKKVSAKTLPPEVTGPDARVLDSLWTTILSRRDADPSVSHSARLLSRGTAKVAQKFGEESVECLIEAVTGDRDALVAESADVLYHLLVMWASAGIAPDQVWAELKRREGVSGIAEKAARPVALQISRTRKIP